MGGEAKRRKEKFGELYGSPECPGSGHPKKKTKSLNKQQLEQGRFLSRKAEGDRKIRRHGVETETHEYGGDDGGIGGGYED